MSSRNQQPVTSIGLFYKQVDDFKEKLMIILNQFEKKKEIVELYKYYDKLMTLKKVNVRKPIELFYQYCVTAAADQILTRDEAFFVGEFSKIEQSQSTFSQDETSDTVTQKDIFFVSQIRDVWASLQPSVKSNIWNYVQVICLLSEKIMGGNVLSTRRQALLQEGKIKA
jgi:hypothetical protein